MSRVVIPEGNAGWIATIVASAALIASGPFLMRLAERIALASVKVREIKLDEVPR